LNIARLVIVGNVEPLEAEARVVLNERATQSPKIVRALVE